MPEIRILHTPGCSATPITQRLLREVLDMLAPESTVTCQDVSRDASAMSLFAGSPTVLVDGRDLEPDAVPIDGYG